MKANVCELMLVLLVGAGLVSCSGGKETSDAYGNFEAREIVISSEATGRLVAWNVHEGDNLATGQVAGTVDTVQLYLKKQQCVAQRRVAQSKIDGVMAAVAVQEQQRANLENEKARVERLLDDGAATAKQMDDMVQNIALVDKQIASTKTQLSVIAAELQATDAQLAQLTDQIAKSTVRNPSAGTVLDSYVEPGELVTTGKALYKLADLSFMDLRAYVSGNELSSIAVGKIVKVLIDNSKNQIDTLHGVVSWVSPQAEFTPKTVQTRDDRVNFVYAFKVRVANAGGMLKIGMPGEVLFR